MNGGMERLKRKREPHGMMRLLRDCGWCFRHSRDCSCIEDNKQKNMIMSPPCGRHQKNKMHRSNRWNNAVVFLFVSFNLSIMQPYSSFSQDGHSPRLLKGCATQLCVVYLHIFSLSLSMMAILTMLKTTCLVPVPKNKHPNTLSDHRTVALTWLVMKALVRLILNFRHLSQSCHLQKCSD